MDNLFQKIWNVFDQFGISISCSATYFPDLGARFSLKVGTKGSPRSKKKKLWKFGFLGSFSKAKKKECDQKVWNVFHQFDINIPCSATYFRDVGACISWKVATIESPRGRFYGHFSEATTEKGYLKSWNVLINLESLYLVEVHIVCL